jgi:Zn-dependent protease with chaperone function
VLVFVLLQMLSAPLMNVVSRREEAEADWSALRATHDPQAARALFKQLATTSLADPDPPGWVYVLYEDHPTIVQRIAMAQAWQRANGGARQASSDARQANGGAPRSNAAARRASGGAQS